MSEPTLYEAAYIIDPSLSEEEVNDLIAAIEAAAEEAGAEVVATRDFKTRRLAYEIKGFTHGNYKMMYFHATSDEQVTEIRSEIGMRQPVIRTRVFVANPHAIIGSLEEEEAEAEEAAAEAAEAAAEDTDEAAEEESAEAAEPEDEEAGTEAEDTADEEEIEETVEADEAPETQQ